MDGWKPGQPQQLRVQQSVSNPPPHTHTSIHPSIPTAAVFRSPIASIGHHTVASWKKLGSHNKVCRGKLPAMVITSTCPCSRSGGGERDRMHMVIAWDERCWGGVISYTSCHITPHHSTPRHTSPHKMKLHDTSCARKNHNHKIICELNIIRKS